MDLRPHIDKFARRFAEVEMALSDPKAFDNQQRAQELSKEYARLKELVAAGQAYQKTLTDLAENRALLESESSDSELGQMAKEELARLERDEKRLAQQIQFGILPPHPTDSRNTIVEIRAGTGGQEAALFAAGFGIAWTSRVTRKRAGGKSRILIRARPTWAASRK